MEYLPIISVLSTLDVCWHGLSFEKQAVVLQQKLSNVLWGGQKNAF